MTEKDKGNPDTSSMFMGENLENIFLMILIKNKSKSLLRFLKYKNRMNTEVYLFNLFFDLY